jgi:hypothetical protein
VVEHTDNSLPKKNDYISEKKQKFFLQAEPCSRKEAERLGGGCDGGRGSSLSVQPWHPPPQSQRHRAKSSKILINNSNKK